MKTYKIGAWVETYIESDSEYEARERFCEMFCDGTLGELEVEIEEDDED